jgi:formate-dependent nitrite reductase cytochrome c552 subunit
MILEVREILFPTDFSDVARQAGQTAAELACIDCHAPDTMQLRVTRPAFMEGIRALKAPRA